MRTLARITHIDHQGVQCSSSQRYSLVEASIHRSVFLRKGDRRGLSDPQGQEHPQLWLAMPGLPPAACDPWLPPCHCAWAQEVQQNYVARDDRQRPDRGGRAAWPGVQMEDKRLGLVYDGTGYPRQAMRAFAFGLGQSTANAWRPLLREGVQKAVAPGGSVPARAP